MNDISYRCFLYLKYWVYFYSENKYFMLRLCYNLFVIFILEGRIFIVLGKKVCSLEIGYLWFVIIMYKCIEVSLLFGFDFSVV